MKKIKEDKWLLVSCLQKSIRKGFVTLAHNYAEKLYDLERSYLVYRLSVIAIEDIGLGNTNLVHDFLSTKIQKDKIEELGGKDYVMRIVSELTTSIKDRSACEVVTLASFYKEKYTETKKTNEEVFLDNEELIVNRVIAGWEILGVKNFKHVEENNLENFIELNSRFIQDEKILNIIRYAHSIHKETHFSSYGLLSYVYEKEKKKKIKVGKFETGDYVSTDCPIDLIDNKWLIDGVDWHTKEGKSAIYEFITENTAIMSYVRSMKLDKESMASIVGNLLFRKVGHQVDKRLIYPTAIVILKLTEQMVFKSITSGNEQADFFKV